MAAFFVTVSPLATAIRSDVKAFEHSSNDPDTIFIDDEKFFPGSAVRECRRLMPEQEPVEAATATDVAGIFWEAGWSADKVLAGAAYIAPESGRAYLVVEAASIKDII